MCDLVIMYIERLNFNVPGHVYIGLFLLFCIGTLLMFLYGGPKKGLCLSLGLLLVEYIIWLYCSTFLFRPYKENQGYNYHLFWSYVSIQNGKEDLLAQNILNVFVFIPVGMLLVLAFRKIRWWSVLLVGMCISASIEVLQFFFHRGFAETDDVMHNTLGCMIGYSLVGIVVRLSQICNK